MENFPDKKRDSIIEKPDITNPDAFSQWLDQYVQKPFRGFDDKTHPDGTPFSKAEQIGATKDQLKIIAQSFTEMRRTQEFIQELLISSVRGLQENPT